MHRLEGIRITSIKQRINCNACTRICCAKGINTKAKNVSRERQAVHSNGSDRE